MNARRDDRDANWLAPDNERQNQQVILCIAPKMVETALTLRIIFLSATAHILEPWEFLRLPTLSAQSLKLQ